MGSQTVGAQSEQRTQEDLDCSCARTRPTQMNPKNIICSERMDKTNSSHADDGDLHPKGPNPQITPDKAEVNGRIGDGNAECADSNIITNGISNKITTKEQSRQPHPNIFKPAINRRSPQSNLTGPSESPVESRCSQQSVEGNSNPNDNNDAIKPISIDHTDGTIDCTTTQEVNDDHKKQINSSEDQHGTNPASKNDMHSLEGFVNRACDTPASSGSDDNNCTKLPDFSICFTRTGSIRSRRSRKLSSANEPILAVETNKSCRDKAPFKFAGIIVSMLGSLCFCTSALTIKLFPENSPYGLQEKLRAVFTRGIILMICCGTSLYMQGSTIKVPRDEIWVNAARALLGCCGTIGGYLALCYISLGDGAALIFSSPVWTSLLSHFLLGEPLSWILLVALPCSLVGIILIAHPALILDLFISPDLAEAPMFAELNSTLFNSSALELSFGDIDDVVPSNLADDDAGTGNNRLIGVCIALGTSLCVSGVYIILKFRRTTKIQTTTFWLGFVTCVEGFIALCIVGFGDIPSLEEAGLLFVNGFFSWIGQTCLQWGLFYEDASILSVVRTSEVAMSFTLSALLLDDEIYWTSILGATIIALVVVLMILNNWLSSKADEQKEEGDVMTSDQKDEMVKNDIIKTKNDTIICTGKKKRCSSDSEKGTRA